MKTEAQNLLSLPKSAHDKLEKIQASFPSPRSSLMMVLRLFEDEFGSVQDSHHPLIAKLCHVSPAHVKGVLGFYSHFKREHHGRYRIMICSTIMCQIRGASTIRKHLETRVGLLCGEKSPDGMYSLEKVECLAQCENAPCMQIDNHDFYNLTTQKVDKILEHINSGLPLDKIEDTLHYTP